MKRNLIGTLSLVALSLLLTAAGAAAQSAVQANVPFAFRSERPNCRPAPTESRLQARA